MATAQLTSTGVSIHNVLIATDLSRYSKAAVEYGFALARRYQAEANLVYVTPSEEFMLAGPEAILYAREAVQRDLQQLKAELRQTYSYQEGADYHTHVLEGPVADCILDCAHSCHADLIVVCTHGRGNLGRMVIGSVAEHVFRRSSVPVLTLGPHVRFPTVDPTNILLATNCSPASERAAHYACSLAREHNAMLTVVHVLDHVPGAALCDRERLKVAVEEKVRDLIAPLMEGQQVQYQVDFGSAVPGILHAAIDCEADYLVLGVHQKPGLLDRFMWPVAYAVVREASCPVLTVRSAAAKL